MSTLDATVAPSPSLLPPSRSTEPSATVTKSSKKLVLLSPEAKASLSFKIWRHTTKEPVSQNVLKTFLELVNASFTGDYHEKNFGGKLRYGSTQLLLDDLNHGTEGAWLFMLVTDDGQAVAGAK